MDPRLQKFYDDIRNLNLDDRLTISKQIQKTLQKYAGDIRPDHPTDMSTQAQDFLIAGLVSALMTMEGRVLELETAAGVSATRDAIDQAFNNAISRGADSD